MKSEPDIYAVIYPLSEVLINRFLDEGRSVFVKYLTHETTKLGENNKLLFYRSRSDKKIIGEGSIEKIEFLLPKEVYSKYKDKLMLSKDELDKYASERISKRMLVINLNNTIKYNKPIECDYKITMAGKYISKERYKKYMSDF